MKRVVVGFVLLVLCAVGVWLLRPTLTDLARRRVERLLTAALQQPSRVQGLSISLLPPRLRATDVVVGAEPTIALRIGRLDVRVQPGPTLREGRPVISARLHSVALDVGRLALLQGVMAGTSGPATSLPSLHMAFEVADAQLRFPLRNADAVLRAAALSGQFESSASTHDVGLTAAVANARLERRGAELRVSRVQLAGGATARGIFLRTAGVHGDGINATAAAARTGQGCAFSVNLDLARWSVLLDEAVQGEATVTGQATGDLADPMVDAELHVADLALSQHAVGDVKARLVRRAGSVQLTDVTLDGPVGHATASASVQTHGAFLIDGAVDLRALDVDALIRAIGSDIEMGHRLAGMSTVSGTLAPLALTIRARADVALPSANMALSEAQPPRLLHPLATVAANAQIEAGGGTLHVEVLQPEQNRLRGDLAWKDGHLQGTADAQVREWRRLNELLPQRVRRLQLTGEMEGRATLSGPVARPTLQASVTGRDLTVNGVAVARCAGTARIVDGTLSTPSIWVETGRGRAELKGTMALGDTPPNNWQLETRGVETDLVAAIVTAVSPAVIPVSGGTVDASVNVRGSWARATINGRLGLQSVYLAHEPIERVEVRVSTDLPQWSGHARITHTGSERLTLDASGSGAHSMQVLLDSTPWRLDNLRGASARQLGGRVRVHAVITGPPLRPSGELRLTASSVRLSGHELGNFTVDARGREGDWTLNGTGFEKHAEVSAALRMMADYPYTLALRLRALDVVRFASANDSLGAVISAEIDLRGALRLWKKPSGTIRVAQLQMRRGDYEVKAEQPIRVDVTDGRFVIAPFVLVAPSSQLRLSGELSLSGQVDLRAEGEGDLALLEVIGRPVHSARGQFSLSAKVRHEPASGWDLGGEAQVNDATVDLGLPLAFTDINGRVTLSGSHIEIVNLDAKAGGGWVRLTGALSPDDGPRLSWELREIAVATGHGLEAQLSGAGKVQGQWQAIRVSGTIEVLNALYDHNLELTAFLPSLREQILPAPRTKPAARQIFLDIRVRAPGGMYIDNNVAEVELAAKLRLGGTVEVPDVTGTVEFVSGEVKFQQRVFTITGGSLDFRGGNTINPLLNISAEAQISTAESDYTVTVAVTGTAEEPRVQLSADDPTLSETDILSLITLGQTVAQLQRQGGGISAVDAVALLPTGQVTQPLANALGVNRVEVEAVQSQASGAAGSIEPRVTIGKDLTDRLRASVATTFGAGTQPMVQLEYQVTRRVSLLGSWEGQTNEQSGAFAGGIKFRYEFRRLPFSLMPGGGAVASPHAQ